MHQFTLAVRKICLITVIRLLHILPYLGRIRRLLLWIQEVNWMHIRCSKDVQNIFWTSYGRSIYVLCPGGKKQWSKSLPPQSEWSKIGKLKTTVFGPFCPWKALNFGSLKMQKVGHFTHCMVGSHCHDLTSFLILYFPHACRVWPHPPTNLPHPTLSSSHSIVQMARWVWIF